MLLHTSSPQLVTFNDRNAAWRFFERDEDGDSPRTTPAAAAGYCARRWSAFDSNLNSPDGGWELQPKWIVAWQRSTSTCADLPHIRVAVSRHP
jgi:hypothetical protein